MNAVENLENIAAIVGQCKFGDWRFVVARDGQRPYLQVVVDELDKLTGLPKAWTGRKWFLSNHMTRSEVVQTVFKAVVTFVEHEVREVFLYRGYAIFDPHYDVDKLVQLRAAPGALDVRTSEKIEVGPPARQAA